MISQTAAILQLLIILCPINILVKADVSKAQFAISSYMNWYLPGQGVWIEHVTHKSDWMSANGLEALSNYLTLSITEQESDYIWETIAAVQDFEQSKFFQTASYFDDILWWSLAYTKSYEIAKSKGDSIRAAGFLSVAQQINDVAFTDAWTNDYCNGGLYWSRDFKYKNAITNELFLVSSARLARLTGLKKFRDRATMTFDWLMSTGMLSKDHLFVDGVNDACEPVGGVYSYNQGVILGGLAELNLLASNASLVELGESIATAVGQKMVDQSGVLAEVSCGDGSLFKGIYTRYLRYFIDQTGTNKSAVFDEFLSTQALSVWRNARDVKNGYFGKAWAGPYEFNDHGLQIAALDCFTADRGFGTDFTPDERSRARSEVCSGRGLLVDGECACQPRFSGLLCESEATWAQHYDGHTLTLTSGVGKLLCELDGRVTWCLSDKLMEGSYFVMHAVNSSSTSVRLISASGAYLNAANGTVDLLQLTAGELLENPSTTFVPIVLSTPESVVGLQYVALRSLSGAYLSFDITGTAITQTQVDMRGSFLTNIKQECRED